jgi:uroporphyrinogen decarboxylase
VASIITLQPIERYEGLIDAAIIFSDILVIPQALGMDVVMKEGHGPFFPDPIKSPADQQYKDMVARRVDVEKELDYVYKAITLTRRKLNGRVPLIGFTGAPWTLLVYMTGSGSRTFNDVKSWIYNYPEESKTLLDKITTACIEYLALQVKAGAQIVQVFDSWASEMSPSTFYEFAYPYLVRIAEELPANLDKLGLERVPMIVFAKGAWYALEDLCKTKYDVVGLDWLQDPAAAHKLALKYHKTLQGNADPGVLYGGQVAISSVVTDMVQGFGGGKRGWIANLGHGMHLLIHSLLI